MILVILYLKKNISYHLFFPIDVVKTTMKSSLERINTAKTKRSELLETKLQIINLFDTYEIIVDLIEAW